MIVLSFCQAWSKRDGGRFFSSTNERFKCCLEIIHNRVCRSNNDVGASSIFLSLSGKDSVCPGLLPPLWHNVPSTCQQELGAGTGDKKGKATAPFPQSSSSSQTRKKTKKEERREPKVAKQGAGRRRKQPTKVYRVYIGFFFFSLSFSCPERPAACVRHHGIVFECVFVCVYVRACIGIRSIARHGVQGFFFGGEWVDDFIFASMVSLYAAFGLFLFSLPPPNPPGSGIFPPPQSDSALDSRGMVLPGEGEGRREQEGNLQRGGLGREFLVGSQRRDSRGGWNK